MKLSATRRALILANIFNSLVAIYLIIIAIVGLVQLRWYHQLTMSVKVRHLITLTTSYFAFFILILVGLVLFGLFISSALRLTSKSPTTILTTRPDELSGARGQTGAVSSSAYNQTQANQPIRDENPPLETIHLNSEDGASNATTGGASSSIAHMNATKKPAFALRATNGRSIVLRDSSISEETNTSICCSIVLHLFATIGLIIILLIWLFNTGELVRDSISTQLDYAFARYQFTNRSNHFSIAIDGMQDINNCCGSLDFTDFPHQRVSGLSSGHYPGSCCGKNIFGVNARVMCTADEVYRSKQTSGCTTILANYYDLISLLVVPVALVCLFVNITIIALITISKRGISLGHHLHHHHNAFTHFGDNTGGNSNHQNHSNLRRARRQLQTQQLQTQQQQQQQQQLTGTMIGGEMATD